MPTVFQTVFDHSHLWDDIPCGLLTFNVVE